MIQPYIGCKCKFKDNRNDNVYTVWDKRGTTVKLRLMPIADGDDQWLCDVSTYDIEWVYR